MSSLTRQIVNVTLWVRLGRPLFLAGGFVMHALGVVAALYEGAALNLSALVLGQITITAAQLMTHYANDYFDLAADRANLTPTAWSGGSRVLPGGRLRPHVALSTALALALIALSSTLVLALFVQPAPLTLPLILLAVCLAWGYSAPPLKLHARGLGQVTGTVVVALLTPLVGYYLQAGHFSPLPFVASLSIACLQFAMLTAVDVPDVEGDARAGKRTLVVQIGRARAAKLYIGAIVLAYAVLPGAVLAGLPPLVAGAVALTLPLGAWLAWRAGSAAWSQPRRWQSQIFWSITLLIGAGALQVMAFAWLLTRGTAPLA